LASDPQSRITNRILTGGPAVGAPAAGGAAAAGGAPAEAAKEEEKKEEEKEESDDDMARRVVWIRFILCPLTFRCRASVSSTNLYIFWLLFIVAVSFPFFMFACAYASPHEYDKHKHCISRTSRVEGALLSRSRYASYCS
jgi:hypothetical protein